MSRYYDTLNLADSLRINNTTVIDSARNLTNIASISASGGISVSGYNTISSYAGSFNFITGSLTGNVTGTLTGNASSATKWATARTLSLTGDVTGSVSWDGSANASITTAVADDSHNHSQVYITDTRGAARAPSYYPDRYVSFDFQSSTDTGAGGDGWNVLQTVSPWSVYNNSHRQQQLAYTGTGGVKFRYATSETAWASWQRLFADDYHPNADKWTTARTITLGGDLTGSVSIDGSANVTLSGQVVNDSHTHDGRYYTEAESDTRFANITGDTFTGNLQINGGYLQAYGLFYLRDDLNFINAAANGWHTIIENNGGNPYFNAIDSYRVGGTTVIDSSRNATFSKVTSSYGLFGSVQTQPTGSTRLVVSNGNNINAVDGNDVEALIGGSSIYNVVYSTAYNGLVLTNNWRKGAKVVTGIPSWGMDIGGRSTTTGNLDQFTITRIAPNSTTVTKLANVNSSGVLNTVGGYQVNGSTVIDSGRNITVGAITASGKLYFNKDGQTNYHSVIDIDHVENNLWSFVFQTSTVGNDNESGFWVGNNGYPDMRLRRDDATVRALISSWETSYVSNTFDVKGGDLKVGGTTVIDSARNATVNKVVATASGMSEFSTDLSSNDDWQNSPISIRERNMAGSLASADMYAPNLNFHWAGRASNSLWMNSAGHLVYGGYGATGIPEANGVFAAGTLRTNTLTDLADTSTFLELEGDSLGMRLQTASGFFRFGARNSTWCHMETDRSGFYFYKKINVVGTTNSTTGYQLNGTTVIDSSRNLTNIGNVTGGDGNFNHIGVRNTSGASGDGISLYNGATGGQPTYGIMFAGTSTYGGHGGVTGDWATYLTMSNNTDRGWIFKRGTTNVASIDGGGNATFTGSVSSSNAVTATGNITSNNGWVKSGGGGFYVSGNQIVNSSRDLLNIGNITCSGTNNTLGDINIQENVSAQGYTFMRFKAYSTGNTLGSIYRAYGSMVYSTSSDYRLKENVVDLTGASVKIMSLPVRRFNFIEHPDRTVDGFLAHEVAEVVPEAVIGEKDAVDSKGKPVHQSIDQSKLVPLLTAGLQEALAEIENLKARLSALEN